MVRRLIEFFYKHEVRKMRIVQSFAASCFLAFVLVMPVQADEPSLQAIDEKIAVCDALPRDDRKDACEEELLRMLDAELSALKGSLEETEMELEVQKKTLELQEGVQKFTDQVQHSLDVIRSGRRRLECTLLLKRCVDL